MEELGMEIMFSSGTMIWDNVTVSMKDPGRFNSDEVDHLEQEILFIHDPDTTEVEQIQQRCQMCPCRLASRSTEI